MSNGNRDDHTPGDRPDEEMPNFIHSREESPEPGIVVIQYLADARLMLVSYFDDRGKTCSLVVNRETGDGCLYAEKAWKVRRRQVVGDFSISDTEARKLSEAFNTIAMPRLDGLADDGSMQSGVEPSDIGDDFDTSSDLTLHFETLLTSDGAPIAIVFDRLTGRGAIFFEGASTLIDKHSIYEPFVVDEPTFGELNSIYLRECHRQLNPPESVKAARALTEVKKHVAEMVRNAQGNNG